MKLKTALSSLGLGLVLAAGNALSSATADEQIRIGGTGNALGTMHLLGAAFTRHNPAIKVLVLDSIGSSGAIKAVPKGAIDIGVTSRALSDEEIASGIVASEYARSPTVFAVSSRATVTAITRAQLVDIYRGKLTHWPDGTPIRPVLRQPGDDNTKQVKALSPAIEQAVNAAEKLPGFAFAVTDTEAADKTEQIPGALGVAALALIVSEARSLRALTLDGVEPTPENAAAGHYPIAKRFFLVTRPSPSAAVSEFTAFVRSPEGRRILTRTGHWLP